MATRRVCDGCGSTEEPMALIGTIIKRDYCSKCATAASAYLERRNRAHERAVEKWLEKHNAILEEYFPLEHLPDA